MARAICEQEPEKPSTAVDRCLRTSTTDTEPFSVRTPEWPRVTADREGAALRRALAGDLDNIVLMALRKEPSRRYGSVVHFADDLHRHLDGRPVLARRDSLGYRAAKFVTRNKAAAVSAVAGVMVTVAAIAVAPLVSRDQGLSTAGMPRIRSLAVLPLDNLSGDPEQDTLHRHDGGVDLGSRQDSRPAGDLAELGDAVQGHSEAAARDCP